VADRPGEAKKDMTHYEVIIKDGFSSAHALRNYYGKTEPLHGHNFVLEVVVRGKRLQNKVKYLTDFVALQKILSGIVKPMDHVNLNEFPPFDRENPSAENLARYIGQELVKRWDEPGVKLVSVTLWETDSTAARYLP
jgi:6-pyruvoyltetrahydropterin/6-carboxytetrahydropterin synthase